MNRRWSGIPRKLLLLIIIGLAVRISLGIFSSEPDISVFASSSVSMLYGNGPYTYLIVYPPGLIFTLNLIGHLSSLFIAPYLFLKTNPVLSSLLYHISFENPWVTNPLYNMMEKSVVFVFDLLTGILLYLIVLEKTEDPTKANYVFALWFLNPFVIVESAIHGAFDIVAVFFTLLSFYFLDKNNELFAGLSIGLGFLVKLFPMYFVIISVSFILVRNRGKFVQFLRKLSLYLMGFVISVAVILTPFYLGGGLSNYITILFTGPSVSVNFAGVNLWSVVNLSFLKQLKATLEQNYLIVENVVTFTVILLMLLISYLVFRKKRKEIFSVFSVFSIIIFGILITYLTAQTQPQYILWFMPFFTLLVALNGRYLIPYFVVSIGATLIYLVGISNPLFFFQPYFVFINSSSIDYLKKSLLSWNALSGMLGALITVLVFLTELFIFYRYIRTRRDVTEEVESDA